MRFLPSLLILLLPALMMVPAHIQSTAASGGPAILFQRSWGGPQPDVAVGVASDSSGNIYVAGSTSSYGLGSPTCASIVILKYSPLGTLLWQKLWYNGSSNTYPHAIAVDSSGNIYVAGDLNQAPCGMGGGQNAFLIKLNTQGALQWQESLTCAPPCGNPTFRSIALDLSGSIYAAGEVYYPHGAGGLDLLLAKFNATTGSIQWQRTWGGSSGDSAHGVAVDSSGNAYVSGSTFSFGTLPYYNAILLSFSPTGTLRFQKIIGSGQEEADGVALDRSGNIYIAGFTFYKGSTDALLLKLDSSSGLTWQRSWGGSNGTEEASGVTVDSAGNPAIAGSTNSYGSGGIGGCGFPPCSDLFLARISSAGNVISTLVFGAPKVDDFSSGVAADPFGSVVTAGVVEGPPPWSVGSGNNTMGIPSLPITNIGNTTLGTPNFPVGPIPNGSISNPNGSQSYAGGLDAIILRYGNLPEVTFDTNPSNGGSINFNGTMYTNGQNGNYTLGNATATADPPAGYHFTGWSATGGLSAASNVSTTTITVAGPGTLKASFAANAPMTPISVTIIALIALPVIALRRRKPG